MQPESGIAAGLDITDHLCCPEVLPPQTLKQYIKAFHGRCIGDSAASIRRDVFRIIALQVAGRIRDILAWVSETCSQIKRSRAHIAVLTETRIQTLDKHNLIINAFKRKGYLAISHNAASQRANVRVPASSF